VLVNGDPAEPSVRQCIRALKPFTLAIDCDQDENSAREFVRHFHEFTIATDRFGELKCDSQYMHPRSYWVSRGKTAKHIGESMNQTGELQRFMEGLILNAEVIKKLLWPSQFIALRPNKISLREPSCLFGVTDMRVHERKVKVFRDKPCEHEQWETA